MAVETKDFYLKPTDGWTLVATNPAQLIVKPSVFHPWRVGITTGGAPADAAVRATQTLTFTGNAADTETVTINGRVYTFKAAPAVADDVQVGATAELSIDNLVTAIVSGATGGTANTDVTAYKGSATTFVVEAIDPGSAGNAITTTETLLNASWGAATLAGGVDRIEGLLYGADSNDRDEPFKLDVAITGEVYVRIDTPAASFVGSQMHFGVFRDQ